MHNKSTLQEIEERFDNDVERFSNINTGQQTTLDALYNMELIAEGISSSYPDLQSVLDIGCGAGNYDVKLLQYVDHPIDITLVDLSQNMLDKAKERVEALNPGGNTVAVKRDFRTVDFPEKSFDVIIATAVLHHLRDDRDWRDAFSKLYALLKDGGSLWVFDLVFQNHEALQHLIYHRKYGDYLTSLKDENYRDHVFAYIDREDSPRSLMYQLEVLRQVGFGEVDVLHKKMCFASYVAFK